jgi:hypothetical protein
VGVQKPHVDELAGCDDRLFGLLSYPGCGDGEAGFALDLPGNLTRQLFAPPLGSQEIRLGLMSETLGPITALFAAAPVR